LTNWNIQFISNEYYHGKLPWEEELRADMAESTNYPMKAIKAALDSANRKNRLEKKYAKLQRYGKRRGGRK
jgi:hypothetical protein